MDMSVASDDTLWRRLLSETGLTATSNYFVMDWAAIWKDIAAGLVIAGALAAWVPNHAWQSLFLAHHGTIAKFWGPLIGPLVAIISFVCSIGNVPLAAVLWNGGISFGGVIAFIFADLIILPILDIYRRYYGLRMTGFLLATFYATMVAAALLVEVIFGAFGVVPSAPLSTHHRSLGRPELHHRPQHHLPRPGRVAGRPVRAHRRRADAADDGTEPMGGGESRAQAKHVLQIRRGRKGPRRRVRGSGCSGTQHSSIIQPASSEGYEPPPVVSAGPRRGCDGGIRLESVGLVHEVRRGEHVDILDPPGRGHVECEPRRNGRIEHEHDVESATVDDPLAT